MSNGCVTDVAQLYEKSSLAGEVGAAVHLVPNANGLLRRWGVLAEEFGANPMCNFVEHAADGTLVKNIDLSIPNKLWQHPWQLCHRAILHEQLKKVATSPDGEGFPAELHTSSKVVELDPGTGTLTLEDGSTVSADLIIGADGIYVCSSCLIHHPLVLIMP